MVSSLRESISCISFCDVDVFLGAFWMKSFMKDLMRSLMRNLMKNLAMFAMILLATCLATYNVVRANDERSIKALASNQSLMCTLNLMTGNRTYDL